MAEIKVDTNNDIIEINGMKYSIPVFECFAQLPEDRHTVFAFRREKDLLVVQKIGEFRNEEE
jgi:hypothetical protein